MDYYNEIEVRLQYLWVGFGNNKQAILDGNIFGGPNIIYRWNFF
jgi:hypothetical protein